MNRTDPKNPDRKKINALAEKLVVCTENLNSGVVVVKSAKDGV